MTEEGSVTSSVSIHSARLHAMAYVYQDVILSFAIILTSSLILGGYEANVKYMLCTAEDVHYILLY